MLMHLFGKPRYNIYRYETYICTWVYLIQIYVALTPTVALKNILYG